MVLAWARVDAAALVASPLLAHGRVHREFNVVESTITDMQQAVQNGSVTSCELVQQYLSRIALYDR